jgi:flagellar basal-body rod protein FlgC
MNLFRVMEISGSALLAERQRAEVVASNLANAETTQTPEGGPYRRMHVIFRAGLAAPRTSGLIRASFELPRAQGVRVERVMENTAAPVRHYSPGHPDADAEGYVAYPAINPIEEMVDLMGAARAYQLNAAAVQATKSMIQSSLDILR